MDGAAAGLLEVGDEEALVLGVRVARGVFQAHEEGGHAAQRAGEGPDEGDRAASADLDGALAVAGLERALGGGEGRVRRVGAPGGTRGHGTDGEVEAPGAVLLQVRDQRLLHLLGVLAGDDAHADAAARGGDDLVARAFDGRGFERGDRELGLEPLRGVHGGATSGVEA